MGEKEDLEKILEDVSKKEKLEDVSKKEKKESDTKSMKKRSGIPFTRQLVTKVERLEKAPAARFAKRVFGLTPSKLRAVPAVRPIPKPMSYQKAEQAKRKWYFSR